MQEHRTPKGGSIPLTPSSTVKGNYFTISLSNQNCQIRVPLRGSVWANFKPGLLTFLLQKDSDLFKLTPLGHKPGFNTKCEGRGSDISG